MVQLYNFKYSFILHEAKYESSSPHVYHTIPNTNAEYQTYRMAAESYQNVKQRKHFASLAVDLIV